MSSGSPAETRLLCLNADREGAAFTHAWRKLLNIGYARNGLLAEVQHQIRQAQAEIGYEYVRFHGILDNDMFVYHEDENQCPYLDFSRVDLLLDYLLREGLKPYIECSEYFSLSEFCAARRPKALLIASEKPVPGFLLALPLLRAA